MKFTADVSEIQKIADAVCPAAAGSSIPVCESVLIQADGANFVSMTTCTMEIEVSANGGAAVSIEGKACVAAEALHSFVKSLSPSIKIECEAKDGKLILRAGRARCSLGCLDPAGFPSMPMAAEVHGFALEAAEVIDLIDRTAYAICTEQTRYYLCGLHLEFNGKTVCVAATNGHVLTQRSIAVSPSKRETETDAPPIMLTLTFLKVLRKAASSNNGNTVVFTASHKRIKAIVGAIAITSKLIDAQFPAYRRTIPARSKTPVLLNRLQFLAATARVVSIVERSIDGRLVTLDVVDHSLTITGRTKSEEIVDNIDVNYSGQPMSLVFNAIYLRDTLKAMDCDEVDFHLNGPGAPALVLDPNAKPDDLAIVVALRG